MVLRTDRVRRHGRVVTAALAAMLSIVTFAAVTPAAQADPSTLSALFLRSGDTTVYRVPTGTTSLTVARGTQSQDGVDYPELTFTSEVGSDFDTFESVTVSAGLEPGTYATSRIPGSAQATLDPGSIARCGNDEPGTLTVEQADYDGSGDPVDFAASFDVGCDATATAHGEIRWNSATPLALAQAPASTSSRVTVGSSTTATVPFTAAGNSPVTMGAATVSQPAVPDDSLRWTVVADGCAGRTLQPGDRCPVTVQLAPVRPDGTPSGHVYADVVVPDGQPFAASAQVAADVYPLSGQALNLQARGAFRQVVLTWSPPAAAPAGWSYLHQQYAVYQYLADGTLRLVTTTSSRTAVVTGLPDLVTARFVVRDLQSGADAPLSVPATGTTASSEVLAVSASGGLLARRLAPDPETTYGELITDPRDLSSDASAGLSVARNQSVLGYSVTLPASSTLPQRTYVCTGYVDSSGGAGYCSGSATTTQWDTAPAVSPDGSRVVFSHAATRGAATTLEIATPTLAGSAKAVPNSAGLSDPTWNATGTGLIAVQAVGTSTELVSVSLAGARAVVPGTAGMSDPDVAADGRIVAVAPNPDAPGDTRLLLLAHGSTTPTVLAGTDVNLSPRFSADGSRISFEHVDPATTPQTVSGDVLDLHAGDVTTLVPDGIVGAPYVLTADGTHGFDTTAPTVQLAAPSSAVDLATTATATWTGTDPAHTGQVASGVRSYDVRYRTATVGHALGAYAYPTAWQATTLSSASLRSTPGSEYCFSARARDYAGNVSPWIADRCTIAPLDDRSLQTTGTRYSSSSYYLGTYSYAAKQGSHFTVAGVTARRVAVLATTCTTCGQIQVSLGTHVLGRLDTHATSTHYRQTLWLPTTSTLAGTLTITTLSAAGVRVDGVVVQH